MQLSQFADYSLRALVFMAVHEDTAVTARQIAESYNISYNHMAKIAQFLAREGFVKTTRGRGGGMQLARPPSEIKLGDVIRKSESGSALVECMRSTGNGCVLTPVCRIAPVIGEAQEAFFQVLDKYSVADVSGDKDTIRALLTAN